MKATHKGDGTLVENNSNAIIAKTNAEVFSFCFQLFEVGNVLKGPRRRLNAGCATRNFFAARVEIS